jgi:hypothetical protein
LASKAYESQLLVEQSGGPQQSHYVSKTFRNGDFEFPKFFGYYDN